MAFGLFFAGIPSVMIWFMARQFSSDEAKRGWTETACEVKSYEIQMVKPDGAGHDGGFAPSIEYAYQFAGKSYQGRLANGSFEKYDKLARQREALLAGPASKCYVNPANPEESVLSLPSKWRWALVLFPMAFIAIGLSVGFMGLRTLLRSNSAQAAGSKAVQARRGAGSLGVLIFCLAFLGAGIAAGWFAVVKPLRLYFSAKEWLATPCQIEWSRVESHSGKSTTYSVDVCFRYQIGGRDHFSQDYDFMPGSSSGRRGKAEVVKGIPAGSSQTCYVNPNDPLQAVLSRDLGPKLWWGLFPLPFLAIGIGGIYFIIRKWLRQRKADFIGEMGEMEPGRSQAEEGAVPSSPAGDLIFDPRGLRLKGVVFLGFFAAFWNGFMWLFRHLASENNKMPFFASAIIWLFTAIGIAMLGLLVWQIVALFNARPIVRISQGPLRLGREYRVDWHMKGNTSRLRKLSIQLLGVEEASRGSGKSTQRFESTFCQMPVMEARTEGEITGGEVIIAIPLDTMHSLNLPNNKILWKLVVTGEVANGPDIKDEHPVVVLP